MKPEWINVEDGWYVLTDSPGYLPSEGIAAVTWEGDSHGWCVYIDEHMPPGDSQHKTLRDAKEEAERRVLAKHGSASVVEA